MDHSSAGRTSHKGKDRMESDKQGSEEDYINNETAKVEMFSEICVFVLHWGLTLCKPVYVFLENLETATFI